MFGRTLVIVNPAARSGKAAEVAAHAALIFDRIQKRQSQPMRLTFRYTVGPKDATQIAQHEGPNYDTVVALGGDGLINEVAKWTHESSDQSTPNARPYPLWQW